MDATTSTIHRRRGGIMRMRSNEEIKAYVDGYNACFNAFCENLKGRKSVLDAIRKMEMYKSAVNACVHCDGEEEVEYGEIH